MRVLCYQSFFTLAINQKYTTFLFDHNTNTTSFDPLTEFEYSNCIAFGCLGVVRALFFRGCLHFPPHYVCTFQVELLLYTLINYFI